MDELVVVWRVFAVALCIKLLLVPSYHSTDFEVHRNWLAITSSLPTSQWYYESTSEWTLDYPPFFAWFEWLLSKIAFYFDPGMLQINNLNYASFETVLFQRMSVMATEIVFFAGIVRLLYAMKVPKSYFSILLGLAFLNPGILIVDHIHFQYNAFMYGIQLLSIASFFEGQHILGGILFAVVLNFKHIYLYQAPAYFIYLLSGYCFTGKYQFSLLRLFSLGAVVIAVFALSFGPFTAHLQQIISRLFPFKRGLCHAYWAPNFWALYSFADRALLQASVIMGRDQGRYVGSLTRGLVGDTKFSILPMITPLHTVLLTLASQLPILVKLWFNPTPDGFLNALILCGFGSYMFGWHVHEKAILLVLIPLCFVAINRKYARCFLIMSVAGYYSLFPLLFGKQEIITKSIVLSLYMMFAICFISRAVRPFSLHRIERLYMAGFIPLFVHAELLHPIVFGNQFEFLPLLAVSVYSAVGIIYCWIMFYTAAMST
ncbi:hypothetical protein BATDEDRAFT_90829 [Batrachochytrium dendrobatidis JAM81]|uniref:Alpha-1,3-glucosyltransferase n=1 Tax=Batrachochytrium dendrobatidis (strain JAM81 / FGSC 10211) TaxID=684364 RepID=F4P9K6_BATDJ|nr:dolichyl-P-Glc:Glc1Man(9)GlcNAc(2)-PP-dolichol alpha-1,3-glucosyltransferase [Batrachochytrium dendrobatidis JAM81]EGF78167.1 hypothetical protein BATDEDRAFT_90829 [Batrachochytrium dendrobatidis JAM81]KAK5667791.1 glycosyl transferase [Batrachochytrium dendrobatidis]|eukprot:XP_006681222.1 hypothetical protein BATDEDRAFT_90829 [Batrachochytrium dendrobatidis JAM81]